MSEHHSLEITVVAHASLSTELRAEVLALCSQAYDEDFAAYFELLRDGVHVLARCEGRVVCHAAWVERELTAERLGRLRTAYVEAVATLPAFQGRGYASAVLARIPPLVSDCALAALSPSDDAFYRRLGWELWQGPLSYFDRSGIEILTPEEQVMIHRLPLTPAALDLRVKLRTDWRALEVW